MKIFARSRRRGGKAEKVKDLAEKAGGSVDIMSGDDGLTVEFMKNGAKGIVSVASNIIPEKMVEMTNLALKGEWEKAEAINKKLAPLFKSLFIEPNPVPAKTALQLLGMIPEAYVRLPLCEMAPANLETLKNELKNAGLI